MGIAPPIHGLGQPIRRRVGAIPCGRPDNDTHFLASRLSSGSTLRSFYRSSAAVTGLGSLFPRKLIRFVYHCQAVALALTLTLLGIILCLLHSFSHSRPLSDGT